MFVTGLRGWTKSEIDRGKTKSPEMRTNSRKTVKISQSVHYAEGILMMYHTKLQDSRKAELEDGSMKESVSREHSPRFHSPNKARVVATENRRQKSFPRHHPPTLHVKSISVVFLQPQRRFG